MTGRMGVERGEDRLKRLDFIVRRRLRKNVKKVKPGL
jgi:hypothetical protein